MKPPPFGYSRPESVADALETLADLGADGKVLAGGQSLVPLLNMRLAAPAQLVDVNRLSELDYVRVDDGQVHVGALARQSRVLADGVVRRAQPLLAQALAHVAHATIRNRGTVVGSIVHADPAAELAAVLTVVDGSVRLARVAGARIVPAGEFFRGPLESALEPGELATEVGFPVLPPYSGTAFAEVARRHGDFGLCGVAVIVVLDGSGATCSARAGFLSMAPAPLLIDLTDALRDGPDFAAAAAQARAGVDPEDDIHASAEYRRHLAGVLTERALRDAYQVARDRVSDG